MQLLNSVNLQFLGTLISFNIVSLFVNVSLDKALQVIGNNLHNTDTLVEWFVLQVKDIMEMLEVHLRITYFQVDDKFFRQKDGMAMGSSLLSTVSNIFMEHFEKLALDLAQHKPSVMLWYVEDTFVVWSHGPSQLQDFLSHLNSLRPSIQFTMETESEIVIAFLDVLVIREETTPATTVYRKPTHTG
jgi:hypothetical protein